VTEIVEEEDKVVGIAYTTKDGKIQEYSPLTFVCSGVSSTFRENLNQAEAVVASSFIALILKDVNSEILFPGYGNVLLEERPILMYPISSTEVRVLVDYKGVVPNMAGLEKFLLEEAIHQIPKNLHEAYVKAVHTSVKYMPNRSMNAFPVQKHGVFLIGDTLNCRHPLTGGAQTVIFADILILRDQFKNIDFKNYGAVQEAFHIFQHKRKSTAATINILANALYAIFSAQEGMEDMKNAVLGYFNLGGVCVRGPMGFLSGLDPRPYYLLTHFFAVAFYGSLSILWNTWSIPTAASVVYNAGLLVFPLVWNEGILSI
jgi:squalene monooxygenase